MANSTWRARTRDRLVVLTGEEVRCEGEERVWLVTVHWVLVYGGKRDYLGPLQKEVCMCLQVFRHIQQVNQTKEGQL